MCNVCDKGLHEIVQNQFQLDKMSSNTIIDKTSDDDVDCIRQVEESIKYTGERFEVKLPWKECNAHFPDTYPLALSRLKCLIRKIKKDNIEDAYNH